MSWFLCVIGVAAGVLPAAPRASAAVPPHPTAAWPMFRGNPQLTGVAGAALPSELRVHWKYDVREAVESSAAIVGGIAYVGSDDRHLYAIECRSGLAKWKYEARGAIRSSPCVVDDTVYFGDDDGTFHAVQTEPGTARLPPASQPASQPASRPAPGAARWTMRTGGEINSSANYADGKLLFGSYDDYLYCISAADGSTLWRTETEGRIHGAPAVAGGRVLVAGCDESFHVFRLNDGTVAGTVGMSSFSGCSPAVQGSLAYVGTFSNQVLAVDWMADRIIWSYVHPDGRSPFYASAAVAGSSVVIGGRDSLVHCIDAATGNPRWTFRTGAKIDASPVIAGTDVFVASTDGVLYRLDLETGREKWRFDSGSSFLASPAVGEGVLIIGTEDGVIYCFGE